MGWQRVIGSIVLVLVILYCPVYSQQAGVPLSYSLYSDHKAHRVGDVVTILIVEQSKAANEAKTVTRKDREFSLSGGGKGYLDFIPLFGAEGKAKSEHEGSGATSRRGVLKATMTARVISILQNGNLIIQGSRVVEINNEKEVIVLSGVVRPQDISAQNTVYSYNIANLQISYKGKGVVHTGQRPGILSRILDWIF